MTPFEMGMPNFENSSERAEMLRALYSVTGNQMDSYSTEQCKLGSHLSHLGHNYHWLFDGVIALIRLIHEIQGHFRCNIIHVQDNLVFVVTYSTREALFKNRP